VESRLHASKVMYLLLGSATLFVAALPFDEQAQAAPSAVPPDAYLVGGGNDWKCERGFRRIGERCNAIAVPVNAYLNDLGSDWRCERGFRKDGLGCAALRVPDHGFINYSGDDWSCEEGFRRQESACLALPSSP
jgi:hypothetical protein